MKITMIHSITVRMYRHDQPTKHLSNMGVKTACTTKDIIYSRWCKIVCSADMIIGKVVSIGTGCRAVRGNSSVMSTITDACLLLLCFVF